MSTYLELFHGRKDPNQDMDGWGFNGPIIGPIEWFHVTYFSTIQIRFKDLKTAKANGFDSAEDIFLETDGDMLVLDDNYYGDFSIYNSTQKKVDEDREANNRHPVRHKNIFTQNK